MALNAFFKMLGYLRNIFARAGCAVVVLYKARGSRLLRMWTWRSMGRSRKGNMYCALGGIFGAMI